MDQATGVAMRELVGVPSEFLFTDYEVGHNLYTTKTLLYWAMCSLVI